MTQIISSGLTIVHSEQKKLNATMERIEDQLKRDHDSRERTLGVLERVLQAVERRERRNWDYGG
jgi:hypothetical protein